ncbi:hypothetical protein V8F06_013708 [Rhypophila decipiens]
MANPQVFAPVITRHLHQPGALAPTTMALYGPGVHLHPHTPQDIALRNMTNMSVNYRGDHRNMRHHSWNFLRDDQNCAFWLTCFPPDVTYKDVFDQIRNCGRVYCVHINNKEAHLKKGAAAKVVFFDEKGARRFFLRYVLNVSHGGAGERIKVPEQNLPAHCSRAVRITGPRRLITYDILTSQFSLFCHYDLEDVIKHYHPLATNLGDIEFRFGRYEAQAEAVFLALSNHSIWKGHNPPVTVQYVADPCDFTPQPAPVPNAELYEDDEDEDTDFDFPNPSPKLLTDSNTKLLKDSKDV